jgi:hypothetical protein
MEKAEGQILFAGNVLTTIARKDGWIEKKLAVEYLGGKCSRCGYNEHYAALQFHHVATKI